jgi:hypothetical protein
MTVAPPRPGERVLTPAPIPPGRARWTVTLQNRVYAAGGTPKRLSDLPVARNRKLTTTLNGPAQFSFDIDGRHPCAASISELATDIAVMRWDEYYTGGDVPMFRGIVGASTDAVTESEHTLSVTATDYVSMLGRRVLTAPGQVVITDHQDNCASWLLGYASAANVSVGAGSPAFGAAFYLPLSLQYVDPSGNPRLPGHLDLAGNGSVPQRSLTLQGNSVLGTMWDNLAKLTSGFDYRVLASGGTTDYLQVAYPQLGVTRTSPAFNYPGNVTAFQRQVSSADYSNYWRSLGNNQNPAQNASQIYGESWTPAALALDVGTWMTADQASDQTDPALLGAAAAGRLNIYGLLVPAYVLTLQPDFYYYNGVFNLGDTVPLIITSGRLKVNTTVRILGITFEPKDDGDEVITVTVGRAPQDLLSRLNSYDADVRALSRR